MKISAKEIVLIIAEVLALVCLVLGTIYNGNIPLLSSGITLMLVCIVIGHSVRREK